MPQAIEEFISTMAKSEPTVLLLGTCDTKLSELLYVRSQITRYGVTAKLMDVGRIAASHPSIDYPHSKVLCFLSPATRLDILERGEVIKSMISAATPFITQLYKEGAIDGVICIGGSGGTSLAASVMRAALPISFPKLLVSTVASGNVGNFVGETDITMMYSVVDIAGQNSILNPILQNAAGMIAGAAKAYQARTRRQQEETKAQATKNSRKSVAITMFGVTTPAVDAARAHLEANNYEVFVFHATGKGGKAMENLISQGRIDGVLDLTTSELADELVGGIMSAGPERLTAAAKLGIPQVVSLGGLDIVNFGPPETVPEKLKSGDRIIQQHNPDITLVRTSPDECQILGQRIGQRLKGNAQRPDMIQLFIPKGGISMIATRGQVFHDPIADRDLFDSLETELLRSDIKVVHDQRAINEEGFSVDTAACLIELMERFS